MLDPPREWAFCTRDPSLHWKHKQNQKTHLPGFGGALLFKETWWVSSFKRDEKKKKRTPRVEPVQKANAHSYGQLSWQVLWGIRQATGPLKSAKSWLLMFCKLCERAKCSHTTAVQSAGSLQLRAQGRFENCLSLSFASMLPTYHLAPPWFSSCESPKASHCCFIELATVPIWSLT